MTDSKLALPSTVGQGEQLNGVRALKQITVEQLHELDAIDLAVLLNPLVIVDEDGDPLAVVFRHSHYEFFKARLADLLKLIDSYSEQHQVGLQAVQEIFREVFQRANAEESQAPKTSEGSAKP